MKTISYKRLQLSSFSPRTDSNIRCFNPKQPFRLAFTLNKLFTGNFLPTIKVVDYGIKTSISHLHTFYFCVGYQIIHPLLVCFPVIDIFIWDHFFTFNFFLYIVLYIIRLSYISKYVIICFICWYQATVLVCNVLVYFLFLQSVLCYFVQCIFVKFIEKKIKLKINF